MPAGVPVATVALNGAKNAGILAAQIIGSSDARVAGKLDKFKKSLEDKVEESAKSITKKGWKSAG
jgi:5-(carboxyamino)imidazole ribonucleotide mutase